MYACCSGLITIVTYVLVLTSVTLHVPMYMFVIVGYNKVIQHECGSTDTKWK